MAMPKLSVVRWCRWQCQKPSFVQVVSMAMLKPVICSGGVDGNAKTRHLFMRVDGNAKTFGGEAVSMAMLKHSVVRWCRWQC